MITEARAALQVGQTVLAQIGPPAGTVQNVVQNGASIEPGLWSVTGVMAMNGRTTNVAGTRCLTQDDIAKLLSDGGWGPSASAAARSARRHSGGREAG